MAKRYFRVAEVRTVIDELYEGLFVELRALPDLLAAPLAAEPDPTKRRAIIVAAIAPLVAKCADFPPTLSEKLEIVEM